VSSGAEERSATTKPQSGNPRRTYATGGADLSDPPIPRGVLATPLLNSISDATLAAPHMARQALVVITTLGNETDARALVTALLDDRLIACGTLLPGARSIYRWEGKATEETEVVVLLKTDAAKWDALRAAVERLHPYQVPELLALPVTQGLERYLTWLASEVAG